MTLNFGQPIGGSFTDGNGTLQFSGSLVGGNFIDQSGLIHFGIPGMWSSN